MAEADAKSAHAAGLQHLAEERRSAAATARDAVNEEFQRADTLDPDTHEGDSAEGFRRDPLNGLLAARCASPSER